MTEKNYEDMLGDALEKLLGDGVQDLDGLAAGLNAMQVNAQSGGAWNAQSLAEEFKRLGQ
ncbi:MAG: hypothetical protein JWQ00_1313 [Noviherbaspirillum sp.]|jgi:hypothetical protein|nr:hypothetical protein [Noviherbaspirillum sp.]